MVESQPMTLEVLVDRPKSMKVSDGATEDWLPKSTIDLKNLKHVGTSTAGNDIIEVNVKNWILKQKGMI